MICLIGAGNMGSALLRGLVAAGQEVTVVDRRPSHRAELEAMAGVTVADAPVASEGTIIAVKPKDVSLAVSDAVDAGAKRILSVAAGVSLGKLHESAGGTVPVLRAMPNLAAMVGKSVTSLTGGANVHDPDLEWAEGVLSAVGSVIRVREEQIDAVIGVSGSGPAYVFLLAEAMIDAGVAAGLSREVSQSLTIETIVGAGAVMNESDRSPADLRGAVMSPGGTTAAALDVFEHAAFRAAVNDAVAAAAARSADIGAQINH